MWGYGSYEGYGSYRRKLAVLEGYLRVMCVQCYSLINFNQLECSKVGVLKGYRYYRVIY